MQEKDKTIVLVAGLGRCGTSLVMNMLHKGGMPIYCDTGCIGNSCETDRIQLLPRVSNWVADAQGKALKILDPYRWIMPQGYQYKIICLSRNAYQQARSQRKLIQGTAGIVFTKQAMRSVEKHIPAEQAKCVKALEKLIPKEEKILHLTFEHIIENPLAATMEIADFVWNDTNPDRVAQMRSVIKMRSPKCLEGFLENSL